MSTSRHRGREYALQILYRFEIEPPAQPLDDTRALAQELARHFDHFEVPEEIRAFTGELVTGVLMRSTNELDPLIERYSQNWKIARMPIIDRALIRMAIYELLHQKETPPRVVIDEAIELAKTFGTPETAAFANGILDAVLKTLLPESKTP